jgi:hypothetical protein
MAWVCLNDAFLSVVKHRDDEGLLVVRARRRDHLINVFGKDAGITVTPERDYKYRVFAERNKLAQIIAARIDQINYGNFKDSVEADDLHELYARFWGLHYQYQQ